MDIIYPDLSLWENATYRLPQLYMSICVHASLLLLKRLGVSLGPAWPVRRPYSLARMAGGFEVVKMPPRSPR